MRARGQGPHNQCVGQDDLVFPIPLTLPLATPDAQGPPQVLSDPWHLFQTLLLRPVSSHSRSYPTLQRQARHSKCSSVLSGGLGTYHTSQTKQILSPEMGTLGKTAVHVVLNKIRAHLTVDSFVPSLHKFSFQLCFAWCSLPMRSPI